MTTNHLGKLEDMMLKLSHPKNISYVSLEADLSDGEDLYWEHLDSLLVVNQWDQK